MTLRNGHDFGCHSLDAKTTLDSLFHPCYRSPLISGPVFPAVLKKHTCSLCDIVQCVLGLECRLVSDEWPVIK